jgi:hypothetical protein
MKYLLILAWTCCVGLASATGGFQYGTQHATSFFASLTAPYTLEEIVKTQNECREQSHTPCKLEGGYREGDPTRLIPATPRNHPAYL